MYNVQKITQCLFGRIGFYSQRDIDLLPLDADLLQSASGRYWEEGHPLVRIENLQAVFSNKEASNWPPYDAIKNYVKGDVVYYGGNGLKVALQDAAAGIPPSNATYWADTNTFSASVRSWIQSSIKTVVDSMVTDKKLGKSIKSLLEDAQLYTGPGNYQDKELKQGRFVGYQVTFKQFQNIQATIASIGTQFSEAFPDDEPLKLYLYHTSNYEPLSIIEIAPSKKLTVQWFDQANVFLQAGSTYDIGGAYFIGYYEDDLPLGVQAVNRTNFNFNTGPCSTCSNIDRFAFQRWYKYVSFMPIAIQPAFFDGDRNIFNWDAAIYYSVDKTFGLNFRMAIGCDISNIICRNKQIFDDAILHQFALNMLKEMAHSTQINHIQERVSQTAIMFELDDRGESANRPQKGLVSQLNDKIKALSFDMSDIDDVCLACGKRNGINYTSM